jgi:hypothetical protein
MGDLEVVTQQRERLIQMNATIVSNAALVGNSEKTTISGRPHYTDRQIVRQAAIAFAEALIEAGISPHPVVAGATPVEVLARELEAGMWLCNGYEFAKYLEENHCWRITAKVVAALDSGINYLTSAFQEATIEWVKRENIQPPLEPCSYVKYKKVDYETGTVTDCCGEIVSIAEDVAMYMVWPESSRNSNQLDYVCYEQAKEIVDGDA